MATAKHGKYVRTYFDQHRVDRWASATALDFSRDSSEYTPLSEEYKLFLPGKAGATSSLNGFIDVDTVTGFDIVQYTDVITPGTHYICRTQFAGTTAAQGDIAYETQEFNTGASRAYDQAGIGMLNWSGQVTDGVYRGSVLLPETAATATGVVGSALNFGATTAGEVFVATIRLVEVAGSFGTVTIALQESSDNGADAYATISGMTATFTSLGVARVSTTSATEAYKKLNVTTLTTLTSATFHVTIGVEAATDV